ncbi:MAG TPA: hypothetical protein PKY23_00885, partial [Bacillota bacterium]|nr:hypothetical protein [Bacillota bacterium]
PRTFNTVYLWTLCISSYNISRELQRQLELFQLDDIAQVSEDERLENIEKTLPNYSEYEVDNTVAHTLHENYIHKRPYACELKDKKVLAREWKTVLLETVIFWPISTRQL